MLFLLVFGAAQVRLIPKTIVILCALQGAVYLCKALVQHSTARVI